MLIALGLPDNTFGWPSGEYEVPREAPTIASTDFSGPGY